jgi:antitoxin HicB
MSYLETTSRVDGAPVRIAVPEDPDGEVEAVSAAFNDPEILRHVGTRETDAEDGPLLPLEQVYAELGLSPPGRRYSGTFRVRVPKDLHRTLAAQARQQGVSLNTLIVSYLADKAARREAAGASR